MAILKTTIDIRDAAFAENTAVMRGLAEDLHAKVFEIMQGEGKARDYLSRESPLPLATRPDADPARSRHLRSRRNSRRALAAF